MSLPAHHLTVPRTARYFLLGEPDSADEIWFLLHGYGQLAASFVRWFEPAARPGRLLVAPEGLSRAYFEEQGARRVGASWMTREDREAEMADYVQYLDLLADQLVGELPPTPPILVHGFSQGTATAWSSGAGWSRRTWIWSGSRPASGRPSSTSSLASRIHISGASRSPRSRPASRGRESRSRFTASLAAIGSISKR